MTAIVVGFPSPSRTLLRRQHQARQDILRIGLAFALVGALAAEGAPAAWAEEKACYLTWRGAYDRVDLCQDALRRALGGTTRRRSLSYGKRRQRARSLRRALRRAESTCHELMVAFDEATTRASGAEFRARARVLIGDLL
jgi:hypothetical protein